MLAPVVPGTPYAVARGEIVAPGYQFKLDKAARLNSLALVLALRPGEVLFCAMNDRNRVYWYPLDDFCRRVYAARGRALDRDIARCVDWHRELMALPGV